MRRAMSRDDQRQYVFDTMTKHEPATEAGRSFDQLWPGGMNVIDRLEWRERILAIEEQAAALRTDPAPADLPELDAAWKEAEAALPEGWRVLGVKLTVQHLDHDDWEASAAWMVAEFDAEEPDEQDAVVIGPTPAAALHALAQKLAAPRPSEPATPGTE